MSGSFTRWGAGIWDWEPFIALDPEGRNLWAALYTSQEAKRILPGLFHGSVNVMSEAARRPASDTLSALDELLEHEMAEYDPKSRVLRLTKLPDAGEYPTSPTLLQGWWNRFINLPACQVRDSHVTTIRWILDQGARDSKIKGGKNSNRTGRPTPAHEELWAATFGTVQIPAIPRRPRGGRRLVEQMADTSTAVQPSLFGPAPSPQSPPPGGIPVLPEPLPSATPGSDPLIKDLRDLGSPSRSPSGGIRRGNGEGEGEGEGGSFSSSGGSGSPGPLGGGGDLVQQGPRLALVPPVQPYDEMLVTIAAATEGRYKPAVRDGVHAGLCNAVRELEAERVSAADLAVVGRWLRDNPLPAIPGDPTSRLSVWVAGTGNVVDALQRAQQHERKAAEASATLAELKKTLGY